MCDGAIDWRKEVRARLGGVGRSGGETIDAAREAEIADELAQHLEDQYAEMLGRGVEPDVARERVAAELSDPTSLSRILMAARAGRRPEIPAIGIEPPRRAGLRGLLASVRGDVRYGCRSLRRAPAFAAVTVLSLAVVIGANTAIFGLLDTLLLERLPIPHAEELVALRPVSAHYKAHLGYDAYRRLAGLPGLPPIEAYRIDPGTVAAGRDQNDLWIELVSGGYFDMLRAKPLLGRALSESDVSAMAQAPSYPRTSGGNIWARAPT